MTDRPDPSVPLLAPATSLPETSTARSTARKKASTACTACRIRRSRCTGGVPCMSCVSHRTECVKDESEDGRRRIAIKRKLKEYEDSRQVLDDLTTALKTSDNSQTAAILNIIRRTTGHDELGVFLADMLRTPFEPGPQSPTMQTHTDATARDIAHRGRARTGSIVDLVNPPIQVPAKPWTNVTDDDDFVSHLVSLWFAWVHPSFRWVESEVFIQAMQSRDLSSLVCKPYLVSCILAEACLLDAPDTREDSLHVRLKEKFMDEAKAGIDAEQGRISLTMIQALGVQWTTHYLDGNDRVGRLILNTQVFLAKGLPKWKARIAKDSSHSPETLNAVGMCLDYLYWALFTVNAFDLADYRYFHSRTKPSGPLSTLSHESALNVAWYSYPLHRRLPSDFHPDCHLRSLIALAEYSTENEEMSGEREKGRGGQEARLNRLMQALQHWPDTLPPCMQIHAQAMPHVLVLHTLHNWVVLVLAKQAAAADAGCASEPTIMSTPPHEGGMDWQRLSIQRAVNMAGLLRGYIHNWSAEYFPPMILQPISLGLLTLLENLETEENRAAFVGLSKILQAVSKRYRVGRGVMMVIRNAADHKKIILPAEADDSLRTQARLAPYVEETAEGSDSDDGDLSGEDDDVATAYLLEKWADLKLDEDLS